MFKELGPQVYCIIPIKKLYLFVICNFMTFLIFIKKCNSQLIVCKGEDVDNNKRTL